jgi:hypothetical protein
LQQHTLSLLLCLTRSLRVVTSMTHVLCTNEYPPLAQDAVTRLEAEKFVETICFDLVCVCFFFAGVLFVNPFLPPKLLFFILFLTSYLPDMSRKRQRNDGASAGAAGAASAAAAASAAIVPVQPSQANGQYLQTLPSDVLSHLASMLPMRDFLKLRGVARHVYDQIDLHGEQQRACLTALTPEFVAQVRAQRKNRIVYLGLHLTSPPTRVEIDGLATFEHVRGIKSLELNMSLYDYEYNDAVEARMNANLDEEDDQAERLRIGRSLAQRAEAAAGIARRALALGLESLSFRGGSAHLDFVVACVLANQDTLQHFAVPSYLEKNDISRIPEFDAFVDVLLRLSSLRVHTFLEGITQHAKDDEDDEEDEDNEGDAENDAFKLNQPISSVPGNRAGQPAWRYLTTLASISEIDGSTCESDRFPLVLPDTLEGLELPSNVQIAWTCPPHVEYLRIRSTSNLFHLLVTHIPPHHATLSQFVVEFLDRISEEEEKAYVGDFRAWLERASLPSLRILAVRMPLFNLKSLDTILETIQAILQHLTHVNRIYIQIDGMINKEQLAKELATLVNERGSMKRLTRKEIARKSSHALAKLDDLRNNLPPHVQLVEGRLPNLEANFLLSRNLSMVSPCTDANVIVERSRDDDDPSPHIIRLQPKRRKTQQE